jgi:hypothetical protein
VQSEVQIHLDGIMRLLHRCGSKPIYLSDDIKRCVYEYTSSITILGTN